MTAKISPRITLENRTPLQDVIPLSTPYLVFLDPSDICNAHCQWCPTGSGEIKKYRKQQLMDFDLYRKIIDDLAAMPEQIKTLRLYCWGEPLMNLRFPEMVRYAKNTGRFGQVDTTSNGMLLNPRLSQEIITAGLDKIFISVPTEYTREYLGEIAYFHGFAYGAGTCNVHVKIIGDNLSETQKQRFYEDFEDFSDSINIEYLSPCWPGYESGKVGEKGIYGQELPAKVPNTCPYIFYSMAINSDGKVSLCFLDWKKEMVMGDLKRESFKDIWNGWWVKNIRRFQLSGLRACLCPCKDCQQLRYGMADNIDDYAEEILKRLE